MPVNNTKSLENQVVNLIDKTKSMQKTLKENTKEISKLNMHIDKKVEEVEEADKKKLEELETLNRWVDTEVPKGLDVDIMLKKLNVI